MCTYCRVLHHTPSTKHTSTRSTETVDFQCSKGGRRLRPRGHQLSREARAWPRCWGLYFLLLTSFARFFLRSGRDGGTQTLLAMRSKTEEAEFFTGLMSPVLGLVMTSNLSAPVTLSTIAASHDPYESPSPTGTASQRAGASSFSSTQRCSVADVPAAIAITSATKPSSPVHGAGLSLTRASTKASVSCT